ncbi:MAG TPA: hypothetical protein VGI86_21195, partial [Acidimicrobiia bacterium]
MTSAWHSGGHTGNDAWQAEAVPDAPPLTTLLSWVWVAWTIEVDNTFEAVTEERVGRAFRISLAMWANGLRLIDEGGITVKELRRQAGAACNLAGLERWRWIDIGEPADGRRDGYGSSRGIRRDTMLRPTRLGSYGRRAWPKVIERVEARHRERFGAAIGELDGALAAAPAAAPFAPPGVSPADGFRTSVLEGTEIANDVPTIIRLGQVLTAATLAQELDSLVSLPIGANVLRVIGRDTVRIRDLPALAGVSREAIAMALYFLVRREAVTQHADKTVTLTPQGFEMLFDYSDGAEHARDDRLRGALQSIVSDTDAFRAGLVPRPGCWRGEKPYVAQTERVLADPTSSLPWHPMVLHRGGWPDGA